MVCRLSSTAAALVLVLCAANASAQELWSNPATWGGTVPGPGAHVVIPQTRRVILDVNPPPLGSITVLGVLQFADKDIDLTVGWIMVHGLLEIGTEQTPYPHRATITLNGPLDQDTMGMGARFIGAMNGGVLEIHGSRRADVDWAVLNAHSKPGDTTMSLALVEPNKAKLSWRPGDLLVIVLEFEVPPEARPRAQVLLEADRSFIPLLRGLNGDPRSLSFVVIGQTAAGSGQSADPGRREAHLSAAEPVTSRSA